MKESIATANMPKKSYYRRVGHFIINLGKSILLGFAKKSTYVEVVCALIIVLFLYTGINKLWDYDNFKFQMGRSPFIDSMNGIIAATLPVGEILLATMLIIKRIRLLGLYLSFALMGLFTGYIWMMLSYAPDLPCSCGGIIAEMSWNDHLIFNSGFTILCVVGILLQSSLNKQTT